MSEIPALIDDLALILVVAGIVTLIFKRLKQPLVLGYIVAGFLVSTHMPYTASVVDSEADHLHLHDYLLDVDAGSDRGSSVRVEQDGLYLPGRYARHVVDHDYLQGFR